MKRDFGFTLGIEEEFQIIDSDTRAVVDHIVQETYENLCCPAK